MVKFGDPLATNTEAAPSLRGAFPGQVQARVPAPTQGQPQPQAPVSVQAHGSHVQTMVQAFLHHIGEDPSRDGLLDTPKRFEKAMRELTSGYGMTPAMAVGDGIFDAEGQGLVAVRDIEFFSMCEHHMLPFWGHISIAYLPGERILGLSKLARVVEVFARRLQVQERLTREVAEAIGQLVGARAVIVQAQASHMCMMMRGVRKNDSVTRTEFSVGLETISESERERLWRSVEA